MPLSLGEAATLLEKALRQDRLAHAYLITGPEGSGKRALAETACRLLLDAAPAQPFAHPDVHLVQPESKSRRIVIEQMRGLEGQLRMRSAAGGRKLGIIVDADRLQPQASNAFLKTLEEPPDRTHLLLLTAFPDQLLETILSRCIEIPLRLLTKPALTARQQELLQILRELPGAGGLDLPRSFGLVRDFQRLLAAAREEAQAGTDTALKQEEKRYGASVDARWLEEREDYFKALSEARYLGERSQLLGVLEHWWADILKQQAAAEPLEFAEAAAETAQAAGQLSVAEALRRSAALEQLREHLANPGVQEPLAIEVAFLQAFGTPA